MRKKNTRIRERKKPKILPIPANIDYANKTYRSIEANKVIIPAWRAYVIDLKKEIQRGIDNTEKIETDFKNLKKKFNGLVNICKKTKIDIPNRIVKKHKQKPNSSHQQQVIKAAKSKREFLSAVKNYHQEKINNAKFCQGSNSIITSSFILPRVLADYGMDENMLQLLIVIRTYHWFVYADGEKWDFKLSQMKKSMGKLLEYGLVDFHENVSRKAYCCTLKGITLIDSINIKINKMQKLLFSEKQVIPKNKINLYVRPKSSLWKNQNLQPQV